MKVMCETEEEYFLQQLVHQKLQGHNMPHPKCKATILIELASELRHLKEEYSSQPGKVWKKNKIEEIFQCSPLYVILITVNHAVE